MPDLNSLFQWLMDSPWVMALLGALLGPLFKQMPILKQILELLAKLVQPQPTPPANRASRAKAGEQVVAAGPLAGIFEWIKANPLILVAIIGGIIIFLTQRKPQPAPAPQPTPPAASTAPAADLQSLVAPVKSLAAAKPDAAAKLAGYWSAGADVIRRDGMVLATTGQLRAAKIRADQLYLQRSPLVASLPGIGAATDQALAQSIGLEDAAITPASRARIADTFDAIAWALGG